MTARTSPPLFATTHDRVRQATPAWSPSGQVLADLLAAPYRYNLFQAISLLEREAARQHAGTVSLGTGEGRGEGVRLRAHIALSFAGADVHGVHVLDRDGMDIPRVGAHRVPEREPDGRETDDTPHDGAEPTVAGSHGYALSTPVMSLAGVQGPLPLPFTEWILQRNAARDTATAAFLDIFHHRFLSFLYRSRKKHTPSLHTAPLRDAPTLRGIAALANLDIPAHPTGSVARSVPAPWLRHAGLLGAAPRSMIGLLRMLQDRLGVAFTARQFMGAWQPLDARPGPTLGMATLRLDGGVALGQRFWDQTAGIELSCVVDTRARYDDFLPGGDGHALIVWLARRHAQGPLDVCLTLHLAAGAGQPGPLGGAQPMRLGWSTWLPHHPRRAPHGVNEGTGAPCPTLPPARLTFGAYPRPAIHYAT